MLKRWTIGRASAAGVAAGLVALVFWPVFALWPTAKPVYAAALAVALVAGLSILWMTAADVLGHRRRGPMVRPLRGFDVGLALLLTIPSAMGLDAIF